MEYTLLTHIDSPADLRKLSVDQLPQLCAELRDFIIHEVAKNPGHLASSLGAIEITVALHYVFATPEDRIIWDVGHQAYAHKILTGRRDRFCTNRQLHGIAPFPNPAESEYDAFIAGHASNSISAALGEQIADHLTGVKRHVVAVIGDGAMTGGLAYEGLNNMSMVSNDLLIVLNDNNMAIDPIHGGFTQYLVDITTSERYNKWRYRTYKAMRRVGFMDEARKEKVQRFNNNLKSILTKQQRNLFSGLNLRYFGPADGHNIVDLVRILQEIKDHRGPKVLHIITQKGKGYAPAEADQTIWHAPGKFDPETGERLIAPADPTKPAPKLWQEVFGETLLQLAKEDKRVVGITPAMPTGCSMTIMQQQFPERVFDVGIAEGHAVTFSAGLAKEGAVPFCNIYSSFLQRSYDNIIHDVALQRLHVILCIDRAGIVGQDGATHHGLLDMAMLRPVPHISICSPRTDADLIAMLRWAKDAEGPVAVRYPRGAAAHADEASPLIYGRGVCLCEGTDVAVLSIGPLGNTVAAAIADLSGISVAHYDMRWLKPPDTDILDYVGTHFTRVITVEDGMIQGGLGSAVLEYFADHGYTARLKRLGINDQFVEHGKPEELYALLGLDRESITNTIRQFANQ